MCYFCSLAGFAGVIHFISHSSSVSYYWSFIWLFTLYCGVVVSCAVFFFFINGQTGFDIFFVRKLNWIACLTLWIFSFLVAPKKFLFRCFGFFFSPFSLLAHSLSFIVHWVLNASVLAFHSIFPRLITFFSAMKFQMDLFHRNLHWHFFLFDFSCFALYIKHAHLLIPIFDHSKKT